MSLFSTFGRPEFLRGFHGWATVAWFGAALPLAVLYGSSVVFVTFLSLYAIVTGHWSAWQSARVEVAQENQAGPTQESTAEERSEFERAMRWAAWWNQQ